MLGVERGSGRRTGKLSNIHLGARDPDTGGFVMLGKTFKGMTDAMLAWQTERFHELRVDDDGWLVAVRPEQVVEIAFDGVQRSSRATRAASPCASPGCCATATTRLPTRRTRSTPSAHSSPDPVPGFLVRCGNRVRCHAVWLDRKDSGDAYDTGQARRDRGNIRMPHRRIASRSTTATSPTSAPAKNFRRSRSSTARPSPPSTRPSSPP